MITSALGQKSRHAAKSHVRFSPKSGHRPRNYFEGSSEKGKTSSAFETCPATCSASCSDQRLSLIWKRATNGSRVTDDAKTRPLRRSAIFSPTCLDVRAIISWPDIPLSVIITIGFPVRWSRPASALITFKTTGCARLVATDKRLASEAKLIKRISAPLLYGSTATHFSCDELKNLAQIGSVWMSALAKNGHDRGTSDSADIATCLLSSLTGSGIAEEKILSGSYCRLALIKRPLLPP